MFKANDLIKEAIERHGNRIALACSFGKDSMVILDMARKVNPKIKVIFENTLVQFSETYKYKDKMATRWNLNLYETKPLKTFWECADEYGLPEPRKQGGKGSNSPRCCYYLKEEPGRLKEEELGVNAIITGIQKCESQARGLLAARYEKGKAPYMSKNYEGETVHFCGQRWFTIQTNRWKYHPIMFWSIKDVWEYTHQMQIPINPVYTKWGGIYPRSGCLTCTAYKSWEDRLSISHPRVYRKLKTMMNPKQRTIRDFSTELPPMVLPTESH